MSDPHLERVQARIGEAILAFRAHTDRTITWRMDTLRRFVEARVGPVAPASPDRVLRALRAEGRLNYRVVSRRSSLYEWQPVPPPVDLEAVRQASFFA